MLKTLKWFRVTYPQAALMSCLALLFENRLKIALQFRESLALISQPRTEHAQVDTARNDQTRL